MVLRAVHFFEPYSFHTPCLTPQKHLRQRRLKPQRRQNSPKARWSATPVRRLSCFSHTRLSGDQPTAIAQLVEGVNDGEVFQTLLGSPTAHREAETAKAHRG